MLLEGRFHRLNVIGLHAFKAFTSLFSEHRVHPALVIRAKISDGET